MSGVAKERRTVERPHAWFADRDFTRGARAGFVPLRRLTALRTPACQAIDG